MPCLPNWQFYDPPFLYIWRRHIYTIWKKNFNVANKKLNG